MKLNRYTPVLVASLALVSSTGLTSCVHNDDHHTGSGGNGGSAGGGTGPLVSCPALDMIDLGSDGLGILDLDPGQVSTIITDVFDRYAALTTASGRRIHFLAQSGVSDAKIRRARSVLAMHLENVAGTVAGADKTAVADGVSAHCGTIAMFAAESEYDLLDPAVATFDADFGGAYVPLFGNRVIVEGSPSYLQSNPAYDQTFGAAAVLVYRHGLQAEAADWSNRLRLAATNAEADGTFNPTGPAPYKDVNEVYLGAVMESHSGVWGHDPAGDGSAHDGLYAFGDRAAIKNGDVSTFLLVEDFFTSRHHFPVEVADSFDGTFDLLYRDTVGYSNRAQYLRDVRLTGNRAAELLGTGLADKLTGNSGNNNLRGRSGDDVLDGGEGLDTAVFGAPRSEFRITGNSDGSTTVRHEATPGLGTDTVRRIEALSFSDQVVNL